MGRPKGTKNVMRTPEEKERIVLEALGGGTRPTARKHGLSFRLLQTWMRKYLESGIDGLRGRTGNPGESKPLIGLRKKKDRTREEELELENLQLRIENARLKKVTE